MNIRHEWIKIAPLALAMGLTACGAGGGGVNSVNSTLTPPPSAGPISIPTPPTSAVLPPARIALVSEQPFKTFSLSHSLVPGNVETTAATRSEALDFRYRPANGVYEITLPGFAAGRLQTSGLGGVHGQVATSTGNRVTLGESSALQDVLVILRVPGSSYSPFTYTSFGSWEANAGTTAGGVQIVTQGGFAYGIPTATGDVPTTGTANYTAEVDGTTASGDPLGGDARLQFDFAAGTLSGSMHPRIFDDFESSIDPGQYTFTQTVFSAGNTNFSGSFLVPGLPNATSFFEGAFTGPQAAELMARWQAPYLTAGTQGTMFGIWVGKKD